MVAGGKNPFPAATTTSRDHSPPTAWSDAGFLLISPPIANLSFTAPADGVPHPFAHPRLVYQQL